MRLSRIVTGGKRRLGLAAGVTALASIGAIGIASPAFAGTCGQTFSPSISGGKASWTLTCSDGNITMKGWVEDTSADGECAHVKGIFNNNIVHDAKACPKGTRTPFSWTHPGTIANGYLYLQ